MIRRSSLGVLGFEQTRPHLVLRGDEVDWLNKYADERQMTYSAACSAVLAWAVNVLRAQGNTDLSRREIERVEKQGMGSK